MGVKKPLCLDSSYCIRRLVHADSGEILGYGSDVEKRKITNSVTRPPRHIIRPPFIRKSIFLLTVPSSVRILAREVRFSRRCESCNRVARGLAEGSKPKVLSRADRTIGIA